MSQTMNQTNHRVHTLAPRSLLCVLIGLLMALPGQALSVDMGDVIHDEKSFIPDAVIPEYEWSENKVTLPPLPEESNLEIIYLDTATRGYTFYLDMANLSVDPDDVIRYTLIRENSSGQRSTSFEGMRCATRSSKTYAYVDRSGEFRLMKRAKWRKVGNRATAQSSLMRAYLCDQFHNPLSPDQIQSLVEYPNSRNLGHDEL